MLWVLKDNLKRVFSLKGDRKLPMKWKMHFPSLNAVSVLLISHAIYHWKTHFWVFLNQSLVFSLTGKRFWFWDEGLKIQSCMGISGNPSGGARRGRASWIPFSTCCFCDPTPDKQKTMNGKDGYLLPMVTLKFWYYFHQLYFCKVVARHQEGWRRSKACFFSSQSVLTLSPYFARTSWQSIMGPH